MTSLTQITNHVTDPAADDRLYIVDVSDPSDGPAGSGGYTTPGDLMRMAVPGFGSRAEAQASFIGAGVGQIIVGGLAYVADATGTALITPGSRRWSPAGFATYEHWGAVGDGLVDDTAKVRATHDWCMRAGMPVHPAGRTYRVSGTILDYSLLRDGPDCKLHIVGEGQAGTTFQLVSGFGDFFVKIVGDTTAYDTPHAKYWSITGVRFLSDGIGTTDVIRIDCAGQCDLIRVTFFNCRGHAVRAREWWDSDCDIVTTRCGDDGLGLNSGGNGAVPVAAFQKAAVHLDYFFISELARSGCNNIYFPKSTHIASSRWVGMYWGPGTRKCLLSGKVHGYPPETILATNLVLDGARYNFIVGANVTEGDTIAIEIKDGRSYTPVGNMISACSLDSTGEANIVIRDGRRNIVIGNSLVNDNAGVKVLGGLDNIVHSNVIDGGSTEVAVNQSTALEPLRLLADAELNGPGTALVLTAANGTRYRLTVSSTGRLLLNGIAI